MEKESHWKDGNNHGLERVWDNGVLFYESNWKDGKRHGLHRKWYEGYLRYESNWKDGEEHGLHREWDKEGVLTEESNWKDGKRYGVFRRWEKGVLTEEDNWDYGKKYGISRHFGNGVLFYESNWKNGIEMKITELVEIVISDKLIKELKDIEFLFDNYILENENIPLNTQIENVIKWGYENDELEDFYSEFGYKFIEDELIEPEIECYIEHNFQIPVSTQFNLYRLESKTSTYYMVTSEGTFSDGMDTSGFYDGDFENECHEIFCNYGEISEKDLEENDCSIEFHYNNKKKGE